MSSSAHRRGWILAGLVGLVIGLFPAVGFGQTSSSAANYRLSNPEWNGLSDLRALASSEQIKLRPTDALDYGELETRDRLMVIYPQTEIDVGSLSDFVVDGGRLLWVDDFGRSPSLLERLDMTRETPAPENLPHERTVEGRPGLPIFEPTGIHPLLEGVSNVVGNHPAVLKHRGGPVVPYQDRGGLVYDMNLGRGKVIVVGDASLLINHMLQLGDNRQFAQNALTYLCRETEGPCEPRLMIGAFEQTGTYGEDDASTEPSELEEAINEAIERAQNRIPSSPLLYYLAILLTVGLGLYLATVFSFRSPRSYSNYVGDTLEGTPSPQSEFEWNLSRFDANRRETNFALPLAILKETFEEIVLRDLDMWHVDSDKRASVVQISNRFADRYLQDVSETRRHELERDFKDVLSTFARIPTRHRVFLDSDAYFSDRDLIQLYQRAMRVLEFMDLEEEYERRTRPFV